MSTVTLKVQCPRDECGEYIELEAEVTPGEMYGTDADDNRGMWVGPSVDAPDPSSVCPNCGAELTQNELDGMYKKLEEAAKTYDFSPPDQGDQ